MPNIHIEVPLDLPVRQRDIVTPATLKYALDLSRADASAQGFTANKQYTKEIVALYNATVKDGRFVRQLASEPEKVAAKLGMQISKGAAGEIIKAGTFSGSKITAFPHGFDPRTSWVTVVAIAVVTIVAAAPGERRTVVDASGHLKL